MNESDLFDKAVVLLAKRDYSSVELSRTLKSLCQDDIILTSVMDKLTEFNYINDQRLLEKDIKTYLIKNFGKMRIQQDLRQRGFSLTDINQTIESFNVDWFELAKTLKERKFGTSQPSDAKEKNKQVRYLQYRGFPLDIIFELFTEE